MMPLNLKNTRHLLTSPHMQAKSTEETLVFVGRQSYWQSHRLGCLSLGPALVSDGRAHQARLLTGAPFPEPWCSCQEERLSIEDDDWMSQREGRSQEPSTSEPWTGSKRHDGERSD